MELIGKPTINPLLFFSGKISGYFTWLIFVLSVLGIHILPKEALGFIKYFAYIVGLLGLLFTVISLINLGRSTRLGIPNGETVFKTNGLYRISRNPMYLGFDLMTLASMMYFLNPFVILLGAYSIVVYHLIILAEEKYLPGRFGEKYLDYKENVKRYIII